MKFYCLVIQHALFVFFVGAFFVSGYGQEHQHVSAEAVLFTVHIDEVRHESTRRFEQLDAAQVHARTVILNNHGLPLTPGYSMKTSDDRYITLRPRTTYGELDQPTKFPDDVQKLMRENVSPYSDTVHTLLHFHHNEIWKLDTTECFLPKGFDAAQARFLYIRSEWVIPGKSTQYDSVIAKFQQALQERHPSIAYYTFYSSFGNGDYIYVYQAQSQDELQFLKDREKILIDSFWHESGKMILQKWNESLVESEETNGEVKPELTDLQPGIHWFGVR